VEENEAMGGAAGSALPPGAQYANLPLPHERDERTQRPGKPKAVTRQAADDLAHGSRDTDLYTRVGIDFDRKARRP
jgi:hypothetical protein